MATALVQDQAALDLAATLDPTEIPTKLRCAVCNKLAVNAFKLPCCDQAICQYCQAALPESCPVCSHSPLEADMCKPHKALRMTIKVHLKTEEKKRAAAAAAALAAKSASPAVLQAEETPAPAAAVSLEPQHQQQPRETSTTVDTNYQTTEDGPAGPGATDPLAQVDEVSHDQAQEASAEDQSRSEHTEQVNQTPGFGGDSVMQTTEGEDQDVKDGLEQHQESANDGQSQDGSQVQSTNGNSGFNATNQNNMDWNGNGNGGAFNPMMNMSNMQAGWGGFNNMMGMPMGQMPMFGNFGPAGMAMNDMSGMNMGMGFGGNFGGNWQGQQQAMGGNFGAGYFHNAGYNQQQMHQGAYGNHMHNQQFSNHNYQNRFQGQRGGAAAAPYGGRGGRGNFAAGRGGHHVNQFQTSHMQPHSQAQYGNGGSGGNGGGNATPQPENAAFAQQLPDGLQGDRLPSQSVGESGHQNLDTRDDQSAMPVDESQTQQVSGQDDSAIDANTNTDGQLPADNGHGEEYQGHDVMQIDGSISNGGASLGGMNPERVNLMAGQEFDHGMTQQFLVDPTQVDGYYGANNNNNNYQAGYPYRGRGGFRGRGRGRGGYFNAHQDAYGGQQDNFTVVAGIDDAPPINAPTGPKAMREGKPNTGFYSRSVPPPVQVPQSAASQKERSPTPVNEPRQDLEPISEQPAESVRPGSRSRSRSSDRKRKYRQRSTSAGREDDEASERRRERRRHHEEEYDGERRDELADGDSGSRKDRSRASSPRDGSRSHRSRRDKDGKHRSSRSQRDSSKEHRRDRHRHRSRSPARADEEHVNGTEASHSDSKGRRDRDTGRDRAEREREKDKDRKRSSRRDRSASPRDKDDKYSSRRDRRERDRAEMAPPTSDDLGFKIKGSRSAKPPPSAPTGPSSSRAPPTGPKRDRERGDRGNNRGGEREQRSDRDRVRVEKRERETERAPRRPSVQSAVVADAPVAPVDIHAQEREARNRERMLKEQQRRESASTALGKRPRDGIDEGDKSAFDPPTGPRVAAPTGPRAERRASGAGERADGGRNKKKRNRRSNYKYEDDENDEKRAARVEEERESSRWS